MARMPAVPGFKVSGIACGIKADSHKDLALVLSETPATGAGVFTKNKVKSPSVVWSQRILRRPHAVRAVFVNSGNANACVGPQGMEDCKNIAATLSEELGLVSREILIASTGVIGVPLPMDKILYGLPELAKNLSHRGWKNAAEGILTTDLAPKTSVVSYSHGGSKITIGGFAKGSGMIHPNMATMLGFLHTDALIDAKTLKRALLEAMDQSFNCITVDGDTSTNDAVTILANGVANNSPIRNNSAAYKKFVEALTAVSKSLAIEIVKDGEGATKFVTIRTEGARTRLQAHKVSQAVAMSSLVKTALFGEDPNWGRIICACGYAGVPLQPERMAIFLNGVLLFKDGVPASGTSRKALINEMKKKSITISIDLNAGQQSAEIYTCDLSYDYVRINAEYTT